MHRMDHVVVVIQVKMEHVMSGYDDTTNSVALESNLES